MSKPIRSDGVLYTGMNSRSFVEQKEKKVEQKEAKDSKRAQLQPYEEIIEQEIAKLRQEISLELADLIHVDMSKTDVKSVVMGLRLADSKLVSLRLRLSNIMRLQRKDLEIEVDDAEL